MRNNRKTIIVTVSVTSKSVTKRNQLKAHINKKVKLRLKADQFFVII